MSAVIDKEATPAVGSKVSLYSWIVLFLLCAVYSFNWMDRYVLVILLEPIRKDLGLSDTAAGLLTGFVFSSVYALAGFPIARLADRGSRRTVIAIAVAAWSVMTTGAGFARGFFTLAIARMGVAVCEAGCSPPAHSLISDYFPPRRRGTAMALYSLGISIGIWAGLSLGGEISERYGWRAAFFVLGLPGLLLALIIRLVVKEPARGQHDGAHHEADRQFTLKQSLQRIGETRSFIYIALSLGLLSFTGSGFEQWSPTYLIRVLGMPEGDAGALAGFMEGVPGIIGTLGAGVLADFLAKRDARWYLWMPLVGVVIYIPAELMFLYGPASTFKPCYFLVILGIASYSAPLFAIGQTLLPPRMRAFGASLLLFVLGIIGTGGGGFMVGLLSDLLKPAFGVASLRHAIALVQVGSAAGVITLLLGAARLRRDLATAGQAISEPG